MAIASRQARCHPPDQLDAFLGRHRFMRPLRIDLSGHYGNDDELTFIIAVKELVPPRPVKGHAEHESARPFPPRHFSRLNLQHDR